VANEAAKRHPAEKNPGRTCQAVRLARSVADGDVKRAEEASAATDHGARNRGPVRRSVFLRLYDGHDVRPGHDRKDLTKLGDEDAISPDAVGADEKTGILEEQGRPVDVFEEPDVVANQLADWLELYGMDGRLI
jgi:hypothetical protein